MDETQTNVIEMQQDIITFKNLIKDYATYKNKLEKIVNQMFQCLMELEIREQIKRNNKLTPYYIVFDTETTGLPKNLSLPPAEKNIHMYDTARILQLSWACYSHDGSLIKIEDHLIKPEGYAVAATHIHGITEEMAQNGEPFGKVMQLFYDDFKNVKFMLAHNVKFDDNIIKSELYRRQRFATVIDFNKIKKICTMQSTIDIVNILNKNGKPKYPRQCELYKHVMGEEMNNAHNAKYDVINLGKIVTKLLENKQLKLE